MAENTLDEIESTSYYQFFKNKDHITGIYFREEFDELEKFLNKIESNKQYTIYIFSWAGVESFEPLFDEISNVVVKTIPQPILDIYKNIFNIIM